MITETTGAATSQSPDATRPRDAAKTRQSLLAAARRRFAYDGYSATTVRDIAMDAGVNVALINRYFTSKEGLFEACLQRAVRDFDEPEPDDVTFDRMIGGLVERVAASPNDQHALELLMLLRSSGDESADRIRNATLLSYAQRMAAIVGWRPHDPSTAHLLLRAQIALATAFGIAILRSSTRLLPLTTAGPDELSGPLGDAMSALLR